jgi:hypothetical protein
MIRFFRLIRHKFIAENKFSKYLLYAIGEIVLVVVGILIALQVNNLNEKRKMEAKVSENLHSLAQELRTNKEILQINLERVKNQIVIGINMIDSLNNNTVPEEQRNTYLLDQVGEGIPKFIRDDCYFTNEVSAFFDNREFASMNTSRYFDLRAVFRSMLWLDESMDEL